MKKNSLIILILVGVIFAGIVISGIILRTSRLNEFRDDGIEVTATVVDVFKEKEKEVNGRKRYNNYLEVSFFTEKENINNNEQKTINKDSTDNYTFNIGAPNINIGDYVKTQIPITSSQFKNFKKGDKVQIVYLPEEPQKAVLKEDLD